MRDLKFVKYLFCLLHFQYDVPLCIDNTNSNLNTLLARGDMFEYLITNSLKTQNTQFTKKQQQRGNVGSN